MKILYVITSTDVGGAEKALLDLSVQTARTHEVEVVCLKPLGKVAEELDKAGIKVMSLEMKWYSQRSVIRRLQAVLDAFRPDLVHAMLYRAIEYTRIACAGRKLKLVTTPHFDISKKNFILRWTDRLLKDLDTLTVAESFSTARYLTEHQKYRRDKVFFLPNGVDKRVFCKDDSVRKQMRRRWKYTEENTVFISVARLASVKDPMTLLQAFRNVWRMNPKARLVYVGEGKESVKLEKFIRESGLEKAVVLAGNQTHINDWLNMADVFVLGSVEESLPLALLEAVRAGLPCIVSKTGDMPLWVEHGKNGFVFPAGDITLLSCFMTELLNENARLKMGRQSASFAERITDTSQQYQHLYQQIFSGSFHVKTNS